MGRVGWHLDDVPQPFLTVRRIAFALLILFILGAVADGLLLGYEATHDQSPVTSLVIYTVIAAIGAVAGGVFATTNKRSPRWRAWKDSGSTMTPGWPDDSD